MLGKLALIGTLGLCTAFGIEHAQDPEPKRTQDPERVLEELERRIEEIAEVFEERFEEAVEAMEEELEERLEAAEAAFEERVEQLEEQFEEQIEQLEEQLEEAAERADRNCTPSRASVSRNCTPSRALLSRFQRARERGDEERARRLVTQVVAEHGDSLGEFNSLAWELLTDDEHAGRHDELALALAERMLRQRDRLTHYMKDTVALALFRSGELEQAVDLQREAIAEGGSDSDYSRRLRTYEQALSQGVAKRIH